MSLNITFRTQLVGGVHEFCHASKLPLLNNTLHLVELIVLLARYKEEGVSLAPKVYITDNMTLLSAMLPGGERLKVGKSTHDIAGLKTALKKCAPLANGGWMIYIEEGLREIEYGVFKASSNPTAVGIDAVVMVENPAFAVVKAFQIASDCVEILSNQGAVHYIFLNHRKEDSPPPLQFLGSLVSSIVAKCGDEVREPVSGYLTQTLFETLRQSHGCLIAVTDQPQVPEFLSDDGVVFDEPIDFADLILQFKKESIHQSKIESKGALLQGMLNSDGIIVFDNRARLLGYNCFVKIKIDDETASRGIQGGARRRAYASLCKGLNNGLCAVFMQSQDGWSEFTESGK